MSVLLVRYSEIGLKSAPVRRRFENQLKDNMLSMLMEDGVEALVTKNGARYYVEATDPDAAVASLRRVFGVGSISVAEECDSSRMEDICSKAAEYSRSRISAGQSFAVKARREGSQGYTSMDVGREAGSAIFIANEDRGVRVDLTDPDVVFYVEVRENRAFVFGEYIRCHAGLPVGSQGKVIAEVGDERGMVAAWLMMKRGCRVIAHGDADLIALLRRYDPLLKVGDGNPQALGYVLGTSLDGLDAVDVSSYDVPVYFPTIGMSDDEVSELAGVIRAGL
ncbi:MAG TPA: THUMP domain-containing protein [Euryarchaeota archaeon]|nr:THUMP domain-containing protein [Euryarchaeota archaeon]